MPSADHLDSRDRKGRVMRIREGEREGGRETGSQRRREWKIKMVVGLKESYRGKEGRRR